MRREFLKEFLGALGAESIEWYKENDNFISGKVIYDMSDLEEVQEFRWNVNEREVPSRSVLKLVKYINQENLLSIDKISISRDELKHRYNEKIKTNLSDVEFYGILDQLEKI